MGKIVLVTGDRGVGKTYLCRRIVEEAQRLGYSCAGVLSPAVFEGGEKVGITLVDISSGEKRPLAGVGGDPEGLRWGRYRFVSSTLEWATEVLGAASPCDLLIIDELGPLELELRQGLVKAFEVMAKCGFSLALVVVRPELVESVKSRLEDKVISVHRVTRSNRDELTMDIVGALDKAVSRDLPSG